MALVAQSIASKPPSLEALLPQPRSYILESRSPIRWPWWMIFLFPKWSIMITQATTTWEEVRAIQWFGNQIMI